MNSSYLSKENLIVKSPADEGKIYIREQQGKFQRIRRRLSFMLVALFIFIPLIKFNGSQAVYFDLQQQQLHLFSLILFPQDLLIVCLIFILAAFLLFYITKVYGRVWCGFTCPQTIWLLLFNWVERRVEGTHNHSKSLDSQAFSLEKFTKKTVKHAIWIAISLLTALVFISYFVKVEQLYKPFFTMQASSLVAYWVLFFTACTYINAAWIKEKMCLHMCPYSRIQSAMFDKSTSLVSYDHVRGESRGKRKRSQVKSAEMGDCVDCNLCVQVCPVGIDIRNGLQYECINCGLCIDACDQIMDKYNYEKGLIAFTSEQVSKNDWKRHISYGGFISLTILAILVWAKNLHSFEVNIIRDRQALYRVNQDGHIENTFVFKIRNKSNQLAAYQINLSGLDDGKIIGNTNIDVLPRELITHAIVVAVDKPLEKNRSVLSFKILDVNGKGSVIKNTSFYSGNGGW